MNSNGSRSRPRVVIIGAGFAGLNAAKGLRKEAVDVLLIDANNFHTFQPLLYQVATAALDSSDIAHQVRGIFEHQKNFRFRKGRVVAVDAAAKEVELADGARIGFDYLIIGAGAVYDDFGIPGVRDNGFVLKSLETSLALRSHILSQFEAAAADPSLVERGALTFVIVGGGPTGVEMAGALTELFQRVLQDDFPELDMRLARVVMLEAGPDVLDHFSAGARRYSERVLRRRGVDLRLSSPVVEATPDGVKLRSGEFIPSHTLIWAAGVRGHPLAEAVDGDLGRGHRLEVNPDLSLPNYPDVFAIGDIAAPTGESGKALPQVAQVAIQGGKHVAKVIRSRMLGRQSEPFRYHDLGSMAIIGRNAGVADLSRTFFNIRLRGFLGWLGWLFLHLVYLPGHRNRISAFFSWAYNYLTFDRHARLIVDYGHVIDFPAEENDKVEGRRQAAQPARSAGAFVSAPSGAPKGAPNGVPTAAPKSAPSDSSERSEQHQVVTVGHERETLNTST